MYPFVETIRVEDGVPHNLCYHQLRMADTMRRFFPHTPVPSLASELEARKWPAGITWKVHVEYDARGITLFKADEYHIRHITRLRLVVCDDIDYAYKSADAGGWRLCLPSVERLTKWSSSGMDCSLIPLFQYSPLRRPSLGNTPPTTATRHHASVAARCWRADGTRHQGRRLEQLSPGEPHQCHDAFGKAGLQDMMAVCCSAESLFVVTILG